MRLPMDKQGILYLIISDRTLDCFLSKKYCIIKINYLHKFRSMSRHIKTGKLFFYM